VDTGSDSMIKVKKAIQKKLETFLSAWPTVEEQGGFLFTNRVGTITDFILIPNVHSSRKDTYQMPETAKALAEKYASAHHGMKVLAEWHNHPKPAVCSVQDCRAACVVDPLYSVMISPTDTWFRPGKFVWYFYKGIKPEQVTFIP